MRSQTAAPSAAHLASVPPAAISGSSGCAYTASALAGTSFAGAAADGIHANLPARAPPERDVVERGTSARDPVVVDVLVRDEPHGLRVDGAAEHAARAEVGDDRGRERV